ncbi:MAG TPA: protein kinase, partial [Kofleriaceae bacterium]|nr:protein kinase [Kofleriaceae bacterium]
MVVSRAPEGPIWGRFRLTEVVGRGSSGRVLKVTDAETGEARALKIVPRGDAEAMLLDEFAQLAKLRHPSLPRVFEVGRIREPIEVADPQGSRAPDVLPAGSPFFLAEWIAGGRCDAQPWAGPELGARVWSLASDIAGALATIHAAGLVHGDVAPQNILVAEDRGVLVDLGLGSGTGARGTPAYMAPEALLGDVEPRGDLYGLGATIVRLVTGRPPFEAGGLGELVQRIVAGGPPPELPGLPRPLADLVGRMIARDADARPGSALAVLDELDQLAPAISPGSTRRARPRVGAAPAPVEWPGAAVVIDAIAASLTGRTAVIIVAGSAASGARELAFGAVRRHQLAQVARGARPRQAAGGAPARAEPGARIAGTLDEVGAALAIQAPEPAGSAASARGWIERVARAARRSDAPVVLELGDDPRAGDLIAALARAEGGAPVIAIVDRDPGGAGRAGVVVHAAPILDGDGVAALA